LLDLKIFDLFDPCLISLKAIGAELYHDFIMESWSHPQYTYPVEKVVAITF